MIILVRTVCCVLFVFKLQNVEWFFNWWQIFQVVSTKTKKDENVNKKVKPDDRCLLREGSCAAKEKISKKTPVKSNIKNNKLSPSSENPSSEDTDKGDLTHSSSITIKFLVQKYRISHHENRIFQNWVSFRFCWLCGGVLLQDSNILSSLARRRRSLKPTPFQSDLFIIQSGNKLDNTFHFMMGPTYFNYHEGICCWSKGFLSSVRSHSSANLCNNKYIGRNTPARPLCSLLHNFH